MKKRIKKTFPQSLKKKFRTPLLQLAAVLILLSFYSITENLVKVEPPKSDHPPLLLDSKTNSDLKQTYNQAILSAKQSILLLVYTLSDHTILQALNQKAAEGIKIKIILDGCANPYIERKLDPSINLVKRLNEGLMHLKILVIDEQLIWLGSANMTRESLRMHSNLVLALNHPNLAQMIEQKANAITTGHLTVPTRSFICGGQLLEMWFLPDNKKAIERTKSLIDSAHKTLRVAMFTWTRMDLAQAIVASKKRGVKVEVIIDQHSGKGTSAKIVNFLIENRIPVRFSRGKPLLHHKMLYIDEEILVNGSANWTKAAFTKNDDGFLILHHLTPQQKEQMENLWNYLKADSDKVKAAISSGSASEIFSKREAV